ncbi:DUF2961 domain-containing protein [Allokutzneria sp. A3M-2-11 16]|uniref:glycoside hydrolase family 172 protein n=1 Tax=Allokutzneria sp. A3M-2-11 16 TaxID=2962043 RepID=UPI0020B74075|nr:glycoside hydrolase family 172 protein [Allokutzneria sp. A3M-2-11 16]MCP3802038.1 DUF2961 domain-containing protein [Allokutzneria sp. A3M-2-11 16]
MREQRVNRLWSVVFCVAAVVAAIVPVAAAEAAAPPGSKGPVGWASYRQLDGMAALRGPSETRQFSSYDRTGRNNDGFDGKHSCLRQVGGNCVIAEREGAGEIESIWFTRDEGVVTKTGWIKVELDGKAVLKAPLQDVVDGKLGAPFVWPLVANRGDTSGGVVIKVPMPFRKSMRVTTQRNPLFHHVVYRAFPDADGVAAFDPKDPATDVITRLRAFGLSDPKPAKPGAATLRSTVGIEPGATARVAELSGPAQISQLRVRLPQVVRSPAVNDDGRSYGPGGSSTFTVAVHPANTGVRLTRRYDPHMEKQRANLLVDGKVAGQWYRGSELGPMTWADQSLEVAPALTAGKSKLTIRNEFVSSTVDVNEFRYDVHSLVNGTWVRTDVMDVGPDRPGEELSHGYRVEKQLWQGRHYLYYPTDADQVTASDDVLTGARLRISFDGNTTVDAPIGEFFGSGLGEYDVRSLMFSMDPTKDGWYTSWWPMPFAQRAVVEIVNASGTRISDAAVELTSAPDSTITERLRPNGSTGYFNATHRRSVTEVGKDWLFMDASGRGVFYGVTHSMRGKLPLATQTPRFYLEGDERAYADGLRTPIQHGTGTEDFYESGWYFRTGSFAMPLAGYPAHEVGGDGCQFDCTGAYRLMVPDAIPFNTALRFGIEPGPLADVQSDYSSTSYWYGQPRWTLRQTDRLDPTDLASRAAHGYTAAKETVSKLTSSFEGDDDRSVASAQVTATTGEIGFTITTEPKNNGVQLVRTADQARSQQRVEVLVDGRAAGTWLQSSGNADQRWLQDAFTIPAHLTSGKRSLVITLKPVRGSAPWWASDYHVRSFVEPFEPDRSATVRVMPENLDWSAPDRGPNIRDERDPVSPTNGKTGG